MESLIRNVDSLVKTLTALQPIKAEHQRAFDEKIRLEFNYNSNHIEGNTLTYGETKLLLLFDKTTGNHELREYEEMKAHDVTFELIKQLAKDSERPISESDLKHLHGVLLVRPFWKEAQTADGQGTRRLIDVGTYKKYPNSVRLQNGEIFEYASPIDTPIKMGELFQWIRTEDEKNELHPIALAAILHYKFVCIHPFDDGNGRISRLLMNYVLLKHNLPPVIVKTSDKKNYLFALNQADSGDINAFVRYIIEQFVWSLKLNIKAAKGESLEEPTDLEKEISVWKRGANPNIIKSPRRNNKVILSLFENCLNLLVDKFIDSSKIFSDLFIKIEIEKIVNGKYYEEIKYAINVIREENYDNYNVDEYYYDSYSSVDFLIEKSNNKYEDDDISDYLISLNFIDFKIKKTFSIQSNIKIVTKKFEYLVYNNDILLSQKNYDQFLSEEEVDQIVKTCVRNIFEEIKEKSNREIN